MIRLSLLAAVFLVATGCDTVGVDVPDRNGINVYTLGHDTDALVGTWDLVTVTPSGECMGENCTQTRPASEVGQSARLVFRADGTATFTYNEDLLAEGAYGPFRREPGDIPRLLVGEAIYDFGLDGDRLYLDDRYVDGPLLEFVRVTYVAL